MNQTNTDIKPEKGDSYKDKLNSDINRQKEQKVMGILESQGWLKKRPDLKVTYIQENVLLLERNDGIRGFIDQNGNIIFPLKSIRGPFFNEASIFSEYREVKQGNKYIMYHIQDIDLQTGKPLLDAKSINVYSPEYFRAWKDLDFFSAKLGNRSIMKGTTSGNFPKYSESAVENLVGTGSIRIKELLQLHNQKQISDEAFKKQLQRMPDILPKQCVDERFDRINDPVTIKELQEYMNHTDSEGHKQPLISQHLYDKCVELINKRDEHKKEKDKVKKKTRKDLKR